MRPSLLLALLAALFAGCDSGSDPDTPALDLAPVLANVGQNVIVATYGDLNDEAAALEAAVAALAAAPTPAALGAAQQAWRDARAPWERSEGFLFGPVDSLGIDPSIDTWPVNETDIQNILDSEAEITPAFVAARTDTGLKGFHIIEFFLFGADGARTAESFAERELAYLSAAATVLADDAERLYTAWAPDGGNYVANVLDAGAPGSQFDSGKDAVQTFSGAVVGIADEVGTGKMQGPLDLGLFEVESRFSGNSKADFQNNIRSIRHVYLGDYDGNAGPGLTDLVAEIDPDLDARVRTQTDAAIAAIAAIPGDFRDAITENPAAVEAAIDATVDLKTTLEEVDARLADEL